MGTSKLGNMLVEDGLLSEADRRTIKRTCGTGGSAFARGILAMGLLDEDELAAYIAEHTSWKVAPKNLLDSIQTGAWGSVDRPLVEHLEVLPLRLTGESLQVAMVDPLDLDTISQLEFFTGYRIQPVIATMSQVRGGLKKVMPDYVPSTSQLEDFLKNHSISASKRQRMSEQDLYGDIPAPETFSVSPRGHAEEQESFTPPANADQIEFDSDDAIETEDQFDTVTINAASDDDELFSTGDESFDSPTISHDSLESDSLDLDASPLSNDDLNLLEGDDLSGLDDPMAEPIAAGGTDTLAGDDLDSLELGDISDPDLEGDFLGEENDPKEVVQKAAAPKKAVPKAAAPIDDLEDIGDLSAFDPDNMEDIDFGADISADLGSPQKNEPLVATDSLAGLDDDPTFSPEESLAANEDSLLGSDDLLGSSDDLLGSSDDLLGSSDDLLSSNDDRLGGSDDLLSSDDDLLATGNDLLGGGDDLLSDDPLAAPALETEDAPTIAANEDPTLGDDGDILLGDDAADLFGEEVPATTDPLSDSLPDLELAPDTFAFDASTEDESLENLEDDSTAAAEATKDAVEAETPELISSAINKMMFSVLMSAGTKDAVSQIATELKSTGFSAGIVISGRAKAFHPECGWMDAAEGAPAAVAAEAFKAPGMSAALARLGTSWTPIDDAVRQGDLKAFSSLQRPGKRLFGIRFAAANPQQQDTVVVTAVTPEISDSPALMDMASDLFRQVAKKDKGAA